jgi:hypothetical protein
MGSVVPSLGVDAEVGLETADDDDGGGTRKSSKTSEFLPRRYVMGFKGS